MIYLRKIESKIKLPARRRCWQISLIVKERQTNLDDLQQIHVATQHLVLVLRRCLEIPNRPRYHTRKFCVLLGKTKKNATVKSLVNTFVTLLSMQISDLRDFITGEMHL